MAVSVRNCPGVMERGFKRRILGEAVDKKRPCSTVRYNSYPFDETFLVRLYFLFIFLGRRWIFVFSNF